MKILTTNQQNAFFTQNGFISFENLFSTEELYRLEAELKNIQISRSAKNKIKHLQRDFFSSSSFIKNFIKKRKLTQILLSLYNKSSLRICFDQYSFPLSLLKENTLEDVCSFHGLICGVLIPIIPCENEQNCFIKSETVLFVDAKKQLEISDEMNLQQDVFIIGYGNIHSFYKENKNDPSRTHLKKWGYAHGDSLKDSTHPIISSN
jgi:hypothetical protein